MSGPQFHPLEIFYRLSLCFGVTYHDLDLIIASLQSLNLISIKRPSHLSRNFPQSESCRSSLRRKLLKNELSLTWAIRISDVDDSRITLKLISQVIRSSSEVLLICPRQKEIYSISSPSGLGNESQFNRAGNAANLLPPLPHNIVRGNISFCRRGKLHGHFSEVHT